jgi:hypothetical protein
MRFHKLEKISKDYFGHEDIVRVLGITPAAASVFAHRYLKNAILYYSSFRNKCGSWN